MKLVMYQEASLKEDRLEIYYKKMNGTIEKIIACIDEKLYIQGMVEDEKYTIPIHDIYYFDTVDKMNFAYGKDKVYKVPYTLQEVETNLEVDGFVRISKSVIVNIFKIDSIKSEINMRTTLRLENGEILVVSRHYKRTFNEMLKGLQKQLRGD